MRFISQEQYNQTLSSLGYILLEEKYLTYNSTINTHTNEIYLSIYDIIIKCSKDIEDIKKLYLNKKIINNKFTHKILIQDSIGYKIYYITYQANKFILEEADSNKFILEKLNDDNIKIIEKDREQIFIPIFQYI